MQHADVLEDAVAILGEELAHGTEGRDVDLRDQARLLGQRDELRRRDFGFVRGVEGGADIAGDRTEGPGIDDRLKEGVHLLFADRFVEKGGDEFAAQGFPRSGAALVHEHSFSQRSGTLHVVIDESKHLPGVAHVSGIGNEGIRDAR